MRTILERRWLAASAVVAGVALVVWALTAGSEDDSAGPNRHITLGEVLSDPEDFYGRTVVVSGRVREPAPDDVEAGGDRGGGRVPFTGFSIGGEARSDQLLVIGSPGRVFDIVEAGDVVQVEGPVRRFQPARLEAAMDAPGRFDGAWFARWEGQPALVAAYVDLAPPQEVDEPGS